MSSDLLNLIADNVVPVTQFVPASSKSSQFSPVAGFDPDKVDLHAAAGGFSTVVEFSASSCLRVFAADHGLGSLSVVLNDFKLKAFLAQTNVTSLYLTLIKANWPNTSIFAFEIRIDWSPYMLEFSDPNKVAVTYQGTIKISGPPVLISMPGVGDEPAGASGGSFPGRSPQGVDDQRGGGALGTLTATLKMPFSALSNPVRAMVEVFCDLPAAEVVFSIPPGDFKQLFDRDFFGKDGSTLRNWLLTGYGIHLAPTICLYGADGFTDPTTSFSTFSATAFPVGFPVTVLGVGISTETACSGQASDVQQFIGGEDCGVITDEFVIERLFKHKWNQGAFARTLTLRNLIKVLRNGNEEDATLVGTLNLDSLTIVNIQTDANTRTDYIRIGGNAEAVPQYIQLRDGQIIGPDKVNFGDPKQLEWYLLTNLGIAPVLDSDPELRNFELQAWNDAYRYLMRPFASSAAASGIQGTYARIDGVTAQVYCLGQLVNAFV